MKPLQPHEDFHDEVLNLISHMPHGVLIMDQKGYGVLCNQKWSDYTGWTKEQLISGPIIDLLFKENRHLISQFNEIRNQIFSKNNPTPLTISFTNHPAGTTSLLQLSGSLYRDKYGMVFAVDLTKQGEGWNAVSAGQVPSPPVARRTGTGSKESPVENYSNAALVDQFASFKNCPVLHAVLSHSGGFKFISGDVVSLTGYDSKELADIDWYSLINQQDRTAVKDAVQGFLAEEDAATTTLSYHITIKSGETREVENQLSKYKDNGNELIFGVIINATEANMLTNKLRHWDRILTKSRKVAMIGGWEYDFALGQINFTEEIYEIFEIGKHQMAVVEFYTLFSGDHQHTIKRCIHELLTYGKTYDVELRLKTGRGKTKWIRSIGHAEWKDHEVSHAYGIIQDITERKIKEEIHQANERLFNTAFQLAPIGIGLVSPEGNWLKVNAAMVRFFDYPEDELVNIHLGKLWPNKDLQKIFGPAETVEESFTGTYIFEGEYVNRENKNKWGRVNINAVNGEHDQPTYYIIQVVDITSKKEFEESLIVAKKEAEEANNAKSRFLSTVSHEIRTPLYGVIGMSNLIIEEITEPHLQEQLEALKFSSDSLLLMVNDILDFSKLKSGALTLEYRPFNLKRLIETIKESHLEQATKLRNKIFIHYDPELPVRWTGDKLRIGQILNNLIANAVKFTKNGRIDITISGKKERQRRYNISFSIKDTGVGIPKHLLTVIFEEFIQADSGITRKYGGTGLGLPIVKGLLEAMNSEPKLESKEGQGTTVSFELNLLEAKKEQATKNPTSTGLRKNLQRKKILLVEDNPVNMMVASNYIKKWNGDLLMAENGFEAVKIFKEYKEGINLILMDLHMPVMNGFEATRLIKEIMPGIPVVALTASVGERRVELSTYGMDAYIIKPFLPDDFYHIIDTYIQ